ncbi:hypothetical protein GLOTRDRAFT_45952 [Gloeophyllum trabeum ATCC 11539]|uniref:DDE Tnp4 domain-containing protein n=1 Tax=Gloeophyllum trabeum (strain ATCC 11539 / FP-39264 / Madison 617) TaxID=670483 RepID=S7PZX0_GLOTA|nr:uncharacterized protein GLOTRDRAFT_45952 [Gloeophyllum trabeum ATCC 11539]EPQ53226.1 hypothetical protein GLOTRDRAFT_45952 [Gloeophyllum trabeum ATCC 11539]
MTGYPSSPYALRPFTDPEVYSQAPDERHRRKQFNRRISSIRIRVEHSYGMLKGRFPSLKELGAHHDIQEIYRAIQAMMVVHNLCIDLGDAPEDIPAFDLVDEDATPDDQDLDIELPDYGGVEGMEEIQVPEWELDDEVLKQAGHQMREEIMNELFPR